MSGGRRHPAVALLLLLPLACGEEFERKAAQPKPPPPPAVDPLVPPGSTAEQTAAIQAVSRIRRRAGLPLLPGSDPIQRAATAHGQYLIDHPEQVATGLGAHQEVPGQSGFTGVEFSDRLRAAGYGGIPYSEIIAFYGDALVSVAQWENSIFHRIPLISPTAGELGFGQAEGGGEAADVMDFGRGGPVDFDIVVIYPPDGASDVPRAFFGNSELPTPPRPPSGWPSGPIVSVVFEERASFVIETVALSSSGALLPYVSVTPDTPEVGSFMGASVAYYPNSPPPVGAWISAHVAGATNGAAFDKSWSFRVR